MLKQIFESEKISFVEVSEDLYQENTSCSMPDWLLHFLRLVPYSLCFLLWDKGSVGEYADITEAD